MTNFYYYKDKPYSIVLEGKFKVKGLIDAGYLSADMFGGEHEWVDVVIYKSEYENPDGLYWVRVKEDFYANFKQQ